MRRMTKEDFVFGRNKLVEEVRLLKQQINDCRERGDFIGQIKAITSQVTFIRQYKMLRRNRRRYAQRVRAQARSRKIAEEERAAIAEGIRRCMQRYPP